MTVTQTVQALGSWNVQLAPETPDEVLDQLGWFGHIVIVNGLVDPVSYGDALLKPARYVGVLRARTDDRRGLAGEGMVFWLGDEDGKGDVVEAEITLTNRTLAQAVGDVLPASVSIGTVFPQTDPLARYSGKHRYKSRRDILQAICDAFGVEYRVNGDGSVDVGTVAQLYTLTPDAIVVRGTWAGSDFELVGINGDPEVAENARDYTTRVVVVGETEEAGVFAEAAVNAPSVPYKDIHGNTVKFTRIISASTETTTTAPATAQLNLNRFNRIVRSVTLQPDEYASEGTLTVGELAYVYDPESGITDPAREKEFRGQRIFPDVIRVPGLSWPITQGHTVAFRTSTGTWLDLTPYVLWETERGEIVVGDLPATLKKKVDDPLALRVDASKASPSTKVPGAPTGLTLGSYAVMDPRSGASTGRITATWAAPTANTDSSVPANVTYYLVQWKWSARAEWRSHITTETTDDLEATLDLPYDVRVYAVNPFGVYSAAATGSITVTRDTIGPPAPADPVVDGDAWAGQLQVTYSGSTAAATPWPVDTNRIEVHYGATSGFTDGPTTLHGSLTPFGRGVDLIETPPGTTRWVRLVPYDHAENRGTPSATVSGTARAVRDGDILSMSVSRLIAGTVSATMVMADRITTALTGARREMNSVGFQAWDASNNLIVSLDGVNNLLTGIFQTALAGRRIVMGAAGAVGNVEFIAPDGTKTFVRAWTESAGVEAIQFGVAGAGGDVNLPNTLWNRINYNNDSGGYSSYRANRHEFMFGDSNGVLNDGDRGFFHIFQVATTAGTGGIERLMVDSSGGAFKLRGSADTALLESSDARFVAYGTSQATTPRLEMTASDGYLIHGSNTANGYQEYMANGQTTFSMASTNGHILIKPNGSNDPDISPLIQLNTEDGAALAWRTLFDGTNQWLEAVVFTQSAYAAVRCQSLTQVSDERTKTDIVDATVDALAEVRGARVVNFRRKPLPMRRRRRLDDDGRTIDVDEVDDGYVPPTQPVELGLTAQTAPAAIVRPMANGLYGIDVGAQGALNMRAIQQLADAVDEVLDRLNALDRKGGSKK